MSEESAERMTGADISRGLIMLGAFVLVTYFFLAVMASATTSTWESSWVFGKTLLSGRVFTGTMLLGGGSLALGLFMTFVLPAIQTETFELECCELCPEYEECEDWNYCCDKCPNFHDDECRKPEE